MKPRQALLAVLLLSLLVLALPLPAPAAVGDTDEEVDFSRLVPEVITQEGPTCGIAAFTNVVNIGLARLGVDVSDPGKRISYQELLKLNKLGWFGYGITRILASADKTIVVDLGDAATIKTLDELKSALRKGLPVMLSIWGAEDYGFAFCRPGDDYCDPQGYLGGFWEWDKLIQKNPHAVVAVGFSDRLRAVRVLNSWGENWGDGGYGWLSYRYVDELLKRFPAAQAYPDLRLEDPDRYIVPTGFFADPCPDGRTGMTLYAEVRPGSKKVHLVRRSVVTGGLAFWVEVEVDTTPALRGGTIYVSDQLLAELDPDPCGSRIEGTILPVREAARKIGMNVAWDSLLKKAILFRPKAG